MFWEFSFFVSLNGNGRFFFFHSNRCKNWYKRPCRDWSTQYPGLDWTRRYNVVTTLAFFDLHYTLFLFSNFLFSCFLSERFQISFHHNSKCISRMTLPFGIVCDDCGYNLKASLFLDVFALKYEHIWILFTLFTTDVWNVNSPCSFLDVL